MTSLQWSWLLEGGLCLGRDTEGRVRIWNRRSLCHQSGSSFLLFPKWGSLFLSFCSFSCFQSLSSLLLPENDGGKDTSYCSPNGLSYVAVTDWPWNLSVKWRLISCFQEVCGGLAFLCISPLHLQAASCCPRADARVLRGYPWGVTQWWSLGQYQVCGPARIPGNGDDPKESHWAVNECHCFVLF